MAIGIIFNNQNVVTDANINADSLEWSVKPNSLVFHDGNSSEEIRNTIINLLRTIPIKYLKVVNSMVVEMTAEEKLAVDAAEAFALSAKQQAEMRNIGPIVIDEKSAQYAVLRGMLIEILNYDNTERTNFNSLLTWLGTQGTLVNRNQLPSAQLSIATVSQALTAIKNRIAAGEADKIQ